MKESEPMHSNTCLATFEAHRSLLFSVAYRMLGSRADAEDMLQETFLRWQQAVGSDIRDPRAFLVTVITRLCINQLQSARSKREEYFGQWLPEPLVTGSTVNSINMAGIDGSLSMAFLVLLERLTPVQRAVFLLREVFDYEYQEIADMLGLTESNCRQILKRAKEYVASDRPRFDVSREEQERLLQQFLQTASQGDMHGLIALLSKDVVLYTDGGGKATAVPNPIFGADKVARFFTAGRRKLLPKDIVRRFVEINGQPGVIAYQNGTVFGVLTLDISEGKIGNIYIVRNPEKLTLMPNLPPAPC
ncbi:MAG: RNA polymerase sigma-70 factor [Acidobacteria bacterium]|nr:RNA polymerase sigma-70 factor [Acidobacteriota bacterium]